MRIYLHIGPEEVSAARIQSVLADKREQLSRRGVLFARSPGNKNHTRLFMATTDAGHVDPLRFNRGYITPQKQAVLRDAVINDLEREVGQHKPDTLILSCAQLGNALRTRSELARLHAMLSPLSEDIRVIAHVDLPTRMLARSYASQILEGRGISLDAELDLVGTDWWAEALKRTPQIDPAAGVFAETQAPNHWLDLPALVGFWEDVFGKGSVDLYSYDADEFASREVTETICKTFQIDGNIGKVEAIAMPPDVPEATLARGRQMNALILQVLASRQRILPRQLWRSFIQDIAVDGPPIDLASLHPITKHFAPALKTLLKEHKGLNADTFKAPRAKGSWSEADPMFGFRPSQYLLGFMWRIDKATREEQQKRAADLARLAGTVSSAAEAPALQEAAPRAEDDAPDGLTETARKIMPPLAVQNFEKLRSSSFAPHNKMGSVNEEELAAAYTPITPRVLPEGNSGNVIVGCMKNEAPYITEWVAYHRAMGVDNFLIYTNGCDDGTSEILDRLQEMGVLQHRNNDDWKGNSPQQYALNQSLKEPVIMNAEWIIHIDVDEFMNVRCGNGTVQDFLDAVPDATNIAMTWRLFGHNGVTKLNDELVIDQFDTCAPKFCPKPHTVWGFKTMFKNIGAYEKISCHRPNKLEEGFENKVKWVNGSGKDMTKEVATNGWRSSKKTIGYDLLQLNHYALRSAESFLIKRQRGRALHVDRSIGINYWIRMDWSDFRDITIKRNLPRLQAEYDRLMQDDILRGWHEKGLEWHRAKAEELHKNPEFADLYRDALEVKLTETERVAYSLALDMES
ncbi:glycosyltransferase family 2 protein [Sulfitobacter donghicola]|uniref:Glycosyl transferase family 2 n=1 Tax=Sulfitobacter donghicola DSW-25 = KCTC 12864 = JCM 14565 TaxID=1300350 RepID=A0A073IIT2_9RHOB|nr:glycosyltransferase family 2 protein [Sulfitobacter donghicola]KEJ89475.1 glycosyl transferase family 2 [Sulfitobacter donghicola DSW-25 = KCTC 12864 = JCM 14565]KIN69298.1 Glycosyl transferase family 2 [Sulfitobacter donghicola DSW-25 = KCTC 12864 = JCM 14565]